MITHFLLDFLPGLHYVASHCFAELSNQHLWLAESSYLYFLANQQAFALTALNSICKSPSFQYVNEFEWDVLRDTSLIAVDPIVSPIAYCYRVLQSYYLAALF